jgi:hypothetical protein
MFRIRLAILWVLCGLAGCSDARRADSNGSPEGVSLEQTPYLTPLKTDSFAIDQNSNLFLNRIASLDREVFLENRIYLYSRAGLQVAAVDTLGHFVKKITQKGDGSGEINIARSAKAWQNHQGDIYVLSNANAYSLYVFDKEGNYRYVIRLFRELEGMYHSVSGSFHISPKTNGRYELTLAVNTTGSSPYIAAFYEDQPTIARFVIDDFQQKVISTDTFWPYTDIPEVSKALEQGSLCWSGSEARFDIVGDEIYLTYPFLRKVYVLNRRFRVKEEYELKSLSDYQSGYCRDLTSEPPKDTYEQTYEQYRTYLSNFHIRDIQALDNLLIIRFVAPLSESDFLPGFPTRKEAEDILAYQGFFQSRDMYWLIYNRDSGKEQVIRLSPEHRQGIFLDKRRLLVEKVFPDREEGYLMKYTLSQPIGQ